MRTIIKNLTSEMMAAVTAAYDCHDETPLEAFAQDAKAYTDALREGRLLLQVTQVSKSGLTRFVSVSSCEKVGGENRYIYRDYPEFLMCLGHIYSPRHGGYKIRGTGISVVFAMIYNLITDLHRIGLVDSADLEALRQKIS